LPGSFNHHLPQPRFLITHFVFNWILPDLVKNYSNIYGLTSIMFLNEQAQPQWPIPVLPLHQFFIRHLYFLHTNFDDGNKNAEDKLRCWLPHQAKLVTMERVTRGAKIKD